MIVFRYLGRDLLQATLAVSTVLLLVIMSGRFIRYLSSAVNGQLSPDILLSLISYRIPGFLELLLPVGWFLAILLTYGRLYVDNEITVLFACGMSPYRLLSVTMTSAVWVMLAAALLTLWVGPWGMRQADRLLDTQQGVNVLSRLVPGRFQSVNNGQVTLYAERITHNKTRLEHVFVLQKSADPTEPETVLMAQSASEEETPQGRYLVLHNGHRYDGVPGQADFRVTQYQRYGMRLPEPEVIDDTTQEEALSAQKLWSKAGMNYEAERQWRWSVVLLIPILTLIAVPLAKVNARQGRFAKLLPAIILYLAYLSALVTLKGALEDGSWPSYVGLWPVHGVFLMVGIALNLGEPGMRLLKGKRA